MNYHKLFVIFFLNITFISYELGNVCAKSHKKSAKDADDSDKIVYDSNLNDKYLNSIRELEGQPRMFWFLAPLVISLVSAVASAIKANEKPNINKGTIVNGKNNSVNNGNIMNNTNGTLNNNSTIHSEQLGQHNNKTIVNNNNHYAPGYKPKVCGNAIYIQGKKSDVRMTMNGLEACDDDRFLPEGYEIVFEQQDDKPRVAIIQKAGYGHLDGDDEGDSKEDNHDVDDYFDNYHDYDLAGPEDRNPYEEVDSYSEKRRANDGMLPARGKKKPSRKPTLKPTKRTTRRPTKRPTIRTTRRPTKKPTKKTTRGPTDINIGLNLTIIETTSKPTTTEIPSQQRLQQQ